MAIRIVKPAPEEYRTNCVRCGAVFEYELEDVRPRYGCAGGASGVFCPTCGEFHLHLSLPPSAYSF